MVGERCYSGSIGSFLSKVLSLKRSPDLRLGTVNPVIDVGRFIGVPKTISSAGDGVITVPVDKRWIVYAWVYGSSGVIVSPGVFARVTMNENSIDIYCTNGATAANFHYPVPSVPFELRAGATLTWVNGVAGGANYVLYVEFDV